MSQSKLTNFFNNCKRDSGFQPSKRCKLQLPDDVIQPESLEKTVGTQKAGKSGVAQQPSDKASTNIVLRHITETSVDKNGGAGRSTLRAKKCSKRKKVSGLQDIRSMTVTSKSHTKTSQADVHSCAVSTSTVSVTTAIKDDHGNSHPSTPTKRQQPSETSKGSKRGRRMVGETDSDDSYRTPDKFDFAPYVCESTVSPGKQSSGARKKLVLPRSSEPTTLPPPVFSFTGHDSLEKSSAGSEKSETQTSHLHKLSDMSSEHKKAVNTEETAVNVEQNTKKTYVKKKVESVVRSTSTDDKATTSASSGEEPMAREASARKTTVTGVKSSDADGVKSSLSGCKSLAQLKEKLALFSGNKTQAAGALDRARKAAVKVEKSASNLDSDDASSKQVLKAPDAPPSQVPAYVRHSSLAVPDVTLTLPYHYRLLNEQFQSTDTVVSWLTNRSEICTFDKLKAAVQDMTKKAYSERHLGQIKTVYPSAYNFRQEKDLPMFGGKVSGYQLTIEANLEASHTDGTSVGDKRIQFTAGHILRRKNLFHRNLLEMVKSHHREFLNKLNLHIKIGDDEIKRWHPKFVLDSVPDIEPSPLPQAPVVKKFLTAKDVLDEVKDKHINPHVRKVLEMVAGKGDASVAVSPQDRQLIAPHRRVDKTTPSPNTSKAVPQSLLERIRAKEARKLEVEMTRSTEDNKRLAMLQRLPELTRILRSHFLSQKRPALPLQDVVRSFVDSYKTALGTVEAENHVKLIAEVVPDFLSVIRVKSGDYVKIDQTADLSSVHETIQNIIKGL